MSYEDDIKIDATVTRVVLGETGSGKQQLAVEFANDSGPGDDPDKPLPKNLAAYMFFTSQSLDITEKNLQTLGWDPMANNWDIERLINEQMIAGHECSLVCHWETYESKERLKVKFINTRSALVKKVLGSEDARALTARLQKMSKGGGGEGEGGYSDDDIPF